ncbi:MAG TPA: FAD-binding dehydrogenase [Gaiellaceae bacterium]|nr:FAD-binding dehydrogenase [Gaiellaceae bacterium]
MTSTPADAVVVGAGLAGLTAAAELTRAGKRVLLLDQEGPNNLGGQAFWSFGGLFLVDSPEQRRLRIHDSLELAWQDWMGSAGFDRLEDEDSWAVRWARAYVEWAAGEKRSWLEQQGISFVATVGWAERGGLRADGHGNSVPRFHIAWGTGTGVVKPFVDAAHAAVDSGLLTIWYRHRVDELLVSGGAVTGLRGVVLADDDAPRGVASNRDVVSEFELAAPVVIVTTGGIGANHDLVRRFWPERLGVAPRSMITGVPAYVDGRMLEIAAAAGVRLVNRDRMWHYTEGVRNWDPIWPEHAIRILPGPSSLWFDALGRRLPDPCLPGFNTLATLKYLRTTTDIAGYDHSWFIASQRIVRKEFGLSGSEQNPDITSRDKRQFIRQRVLNKAAPDPVEAFKRHGQDFVVADRLEELVAGMNRLATDAPPLDVAAIRAQIAARDAQLHNPFTKDSQIMAIRNARKYIGDRLSRTAPPHAILDPANGPLVGVKLHILTRKTLGGIQTDLQSRALDSGGAPIDGLYAAGEVAGFGGGGVHGYNALEGTFLGGCLFSGRAAGRDAVERLGG